MKKSLIACFLALVLINLAFASAVPNLEVKKIDKGSIVISELQNPAAFDFEITNNGASESFEIYSFVGVSFMPEGRFELPAGKTTMQVLAYPSQEVRSKVSGLFNFEYQLIGQSSGVFKDTLTIKIAPLKEVLKINPLNIDYMDDTASIEVINNENTNLGSLKMKFNSVFFNEEKTISLGPYEKKTVQLAVTNPRMQETPAGAYVVTADVQMLTAQERIDGVVKYLEKQGTSVRKESSGWIIRTTKITKKNEGNTPVSDRIEATKNVITRLFTTFSESPLGTERNGVIVNYVWEKDLKPNDSWSVVITTNYTFPFLIAALIIFIAMMVYAYRRKALVLEKRVSFVKTSTGNFALKVRLHVKARRAIENIEVNDRVPHAMKIYEKGGMPQRLDAPNRRMIWEIDRLNAGEERIFSYIIYSNINVVGKYELPAASAKFVKDNKQMHAYSNRTYFISDIQAG